MRKKCYSSRLGTKVLGSEGKKVWGRRSGEERSVGERGGVSSC